MKSIDSKLVALLHDGVLETDAKLSRDVLKELDVDELESFRGRLSILMSGSA